MGWVLDVAVSEQGAKESTCTNTGIVAKLNLNQPNYRNSHIAYVPSEGKHIWWSVLGCLFSPKPQEFLAT